MSRGCILGGLADHNLTLTDYLPSLSNFTTVWPAFVRKTCPGLSNNLFETPMQIGGQHTSSNDPLGTYAAAKSVWKDQGHIAKALCILHAFDYACFDKISNSIPPLCLEVYNSQKFMGNILI